MPLPIGLPARYKLTPERQRILEESRDVVVEAEYRLTQATDAGIDVTDERERLTKLSRQLEGILRVYGK